MRTLATLAATVALTFAVAGPAAAAPQPGTPTPRAPHPRAAAAVSLPLCVTTTWRAKHTGKPKTRPGQVCILTPGMWLPHSWQIIAVGAVGDGESFAIVRRPAVKHRPLPVGTLPFCTVRCPGRVFPS